MTFRAIAAILSCLVAKAVTASFLKARRDARRGLTSDDNVVRNLIGDQVIYTYDPHLFDMYKNCKGLADSWAIPPNKQILYEEPKHNVDVFFVRSMTMQEPYARSRDVDPSKAKLFVVPVYWTQSHAGLCGDHEKNKQQLKEVLSTSPWFTKFHGRNHFFICDRMDKCQDARETFENVILGAFEIFWTPGLPYDHPYVTGHSVPVGDTTYKAIDRCSDLIALPPEPLLKRKYRITSVGQTGGHLLDGGIDPYEMRRKLWCSWIDEKNHPQDILVTSYTKECNSSNEENFMLKHRMHVCDAYEVLRQSQMTFSFSGDTPTTDRIYNAFDTVTPIVVLSHEKLRLLRTLPARYTVPWEDILLEVNSTEYTKAPLQTVRKFVQDMPNERLWGVQQLMEKYKYHVLWHLDKTEATGHALKQALEWVYHDEGEGLYDNQIGTS